LLQFLRESDLGLEIDSLRAVAEGAKPAESTSKFTALDSRGRPNGFLICSPRVEPDNVSTSIQRGRQAKGLLGPGLGDVILDPIFEAAWEGLSIGLFPYRRPLSDSRVIRKLQRIRLKPRILNWLREVTARATPPTSAGAAERLFLDPLRQLSEDARISRPVRAGAADALEAILNGRLVPRTVLMHGDLWLGNLLTARGMAADPSAERRDPPFTLIDWGSSRTEGYAVYDLIRIAHSTGLTGLALGTELDRHCRLLECDRRGALIYLYAGLASIGLSLNCFPFPAYVHLIETCLRIFQTSGD
jgi:hypothetical protein